MRKVFISAGILFTLMLAAGVLLAMTYFRGAWVAVLPPPRDITGDIPSTPPQNVPPAENATDMPLALPRGFSISLFAKDLPGARVMRFDTMGNLWVSQPREGVVSMLEIAGGVVARQQAVFKNLNRPHGLAFDPASEFSLYIAEENKLSRVGVYSDEPMQKVLDLPHGGNHTSRTIGFGPDGNLYLAIGSTCNVCHEADDRRAKMFTVDLATKSLKEFARGLRNAVFFTWHPRTKQLWATEMGRDFLGDNLPPDEVNIVEEGKNYGWPVCYGKNIHDTDFDKNTYIRNPCMEPFEAPSRIDLQAHSAPLGLVFVPESEAWPSEYHDDLLVAYHGSWNRNIPTGYKIVRFELDAKGNFMNVGGDGNPIAEDFASGWFTNDGALGRPVELVFGPDEALYVSDDKAGVIYKIAPRR